MKICPHCNLYIIEKEVNSISDKFPEYQHIKFDNDLIYPKCMESNNERYKLEYTTHIPNNSYKFNPLNSIENTIQIMSGTHTRTI